MSDQAKVVSLQSKSSRAQSSAGVARLPAPLQILRDKGRQSLTKLLRQLFDKADDKLFELADNAANNQDQNVFFDSMREVRLKRREVEAGVLSVIDNAYAAVLSMSAAAGHEQTEETSLDNLSLVANEELEELVAVDAMVARAKENNTEAVQHLSMRIDSLVPLKVYSKNNPLGPDVITNAFVQATKNVAIDIKAKLVLFKLFEACVLKQLHILYKQYNQFLAEQNILPSLQQDLKQSRKPATRTQSAAPMSATDTSGQGGAEVLQQLRGLLHEGTSETDAEPARAMAPLAADELIHLLSSLQAGQPSAGNRLLDIRQQLDAQLQPQQKRVGQVDDDVINLVNMLFEFILDDRSLAEPMKLLLGRLQIPILKVAIADKSFFGRGGHPARRLLNEIATAALGWQDDGQRADPLYRRIDSIVQTILTQFDSNVEIFSEQLTEFLNFQQKEQRRAAILEKRTLDAEDGKAKSEQARAIVLKALAPIVQRYPALPAQAKEMLEGPWSNVLFLHYLQSSAAASVQPCTESSEWKGLLQTAAELAWSVSPDSIISDRKELLARVPPLLNRVRAGLESISFSPYDMSMLFKRLEVLHLQRMKRLSANPDSPVTALDSDAQTAPQQSVVEPSVPELQVFDKTAVRPVVKVAPKPPAAAESANESVIAKDAQSSSDAGQLSAAVQDKSLSTDGHSQGAVGAPVSEPVEALESSRNVNVSDQSVEAAATPKPVTATATAPVNATATDGAASTTTATTTTVTTISESVSASSDDDWQGVSQSAKAIVHRIKPGAWFEWQAEGEDERVRCRLAAVIKSLDKYIFVNRNGMKVVEKRQPELAQAIDCGSMRLLDDGVLFDRALEAVIGNLRSTSKTA